ncbi:putative outer membrane protein [Alcanivorax hongdengensis A-11-3]|uniref:Putative outer membrane protein n=1 Tax=Alcanivorax hongdengensis A-11-3 TaxID=1177179 RepID=L0W9S1_9GAMM|nr:outer membrane protein transport protein [Alcanivorax hongdengensis]EKF73711.1 putative outer membrane protein [Alcanivorax hongdengensis A-11-3]
MKYFLRTALATAIAATSSQVLANGLAINEQSASTAGTAYAGRASTANDASALYGNPAAMARLPGSQISAGLAFVDASTDISHARGAGGSNDGDMVPFSTIPFGYYTTALNDKWHAGIGVYAPYGLISDYEDGWEGRYHGLYSKVQVITVQPTISYALNDRISFGVGPTLNRIDGELTSNLPNANFGGSGDAEVKIKGDDTAVGYNAGVLFALSNDLDWGVTYHSKVDYTLDGDTQVSGANGMLGPIPPNPMVPTGLPGLNGSYDASLDITLPESVDSSVTWRTSDALTLFAGTTWTRWSRLDKIVVENSGVNAAYAANFNTVEEGLNWEDTWSYALGASYKLNPQWVVRTGFAVDPSPTDNENRTVRIPVGDRKTVTLGAGWTPSDSLSVDFAYAYLWENTAQVNQDEYHADYDNSANGVTAQVNYKF